MVQGWTPQKVDAFKAAFLDFLKYVKINSKEKGGGYCLADGIYDAQHRFLNGIFEGLSHDVHDFKILKSRQLGISTISEALFIFYLSMFPGIQASVIYDTAPHLRAARLRIRNVITNLPRSLKFGKIIEDSRDLLAFQSGSVINWIAAGVRETESSGGLGRGSGSNLIWSSEVSSWRNEEGIQSLIETLSESYPDRLYIWESPLALDTPLPTPHGWKTIGSINVGDLVYGEDGKETEVVGLSPVFEGRRCFNIVFDTGEEIVSDADHKWQVDRMGSSCSRWSTKVVATAQLDPAKDRIWLGEPINGAEQNPRRNRFARIISINEVPSVPVKCISVDTPSHLFKVGKTMIPTHNTARGFNHWRDMWMDAKEDDLSQRAIFIGWWAHPLHQFDRANPKFRRYGDREPSPKEQVVIDRVSKDYGHTITQEQLAWYRWKIDPTRVAEEDENKSGGQYKQQEQPSTENECFTQSGSSFFDHIALNQQSVRSTTFTRSKNYRYLYGIEFPQTIIVPEINRHLVELRVWDEPQPGVHYVVAADPAYGRNPDNDRSAIQVCACYADCIEQVAEYASATTNTKQFAWVIASLAAFYGRANRVNVILEVDGPGDAVWQEWESLPAKVRSPYLRHSAEDRGLVDVFKNVSNFMFKRSDAIGGGPNAWQWKTGNRKEAIMERIRAYTQTGQLIVKSMDTIEEMRTMARNGASIEAPSHKHDDRVLALAFAIKCWEGEVQPGLLARNHTKANVLEAQKMTTAGRFSIFMSNQLENLFQQKRALAKQAAREERLARRRGR